MIPVKMLAHRGFWIKPAEQNTIVAFSKAFQNNFGVEFDVRNHGKSLIIAHDIPESDVPSLDDVLQCYRDFNSEELLAINIKADGLLPMLLQKLHAYSIENYFVFDMSVPETIKYSRSNEKVNIYIRCSEYENENWLRDIPQGVWLDNFGGFDQFNDKLVNLLINNTSIALVSPELHQCEFQTVWESWRHIFTQYPDYLGSIHLCTDYPQEASNYFGERVYAESNFV